MSENPLNSLLCDSRIRRIFYDDEWYYSAIDIVATVLDLPSKTAKNHFSTLKKRLSKEMADSSFYYKKLKLISRDGKKYLTEVVNIEQVLRLIQSISAPEVEPIKMWLVEKGKQNLENTYHTE